MDSHKTVKQGWDTHQQLDEKSSDFVGVSIHVCCIVKTSPNEKSIYSFLLCVVKNGMIWIFGKVGYQNVMVRYQWRDDLCSTELSIATVNIVTRNALFAFDFSSTGRTTAELLSQSFDGMKNNKELWCWPPWEQWMINSLFFFEKAKKRLTKKKGKTFGRLELWFAFKSVKK